MCAGYISSGRPYATVYKRKITCEKHAKGVVGLCNAIPYI